VAREEKVSERTTCSFLGITRRTIQNWRRHGVKDKRKGSARHVGHRLSEEQEQEFYDQAISKRFADRTPEEIVATLAGEKIYLGSPATLYRILRKRKALQHRQSSKKPVTAVKAQHLEVTGPNQVWSWDITWLKTDVAGMFKYAYTVMDLFDRVIVGWTIEENESDTHAKTLFERILRDLGVVPKIIHADNGAPMRGVTLAVFLDSLGISRSYSRPRCSDDNAHIESYHKTLKYTVGYPKFFISTAHARTWYADFIHWYNYEHLHSGLGYVTPMQRRTGEAEAIYATREATLREARAKNPLRWRQGKIRIYKSLAVRTFYRPVHLASCQVSCKSW
jgi:transposase InsO family protein